MGTPTPAILLVDDEPANLVALEGILESLDCRLVLADSGDAALRHVLRTDFALVLLDVQMPKMDGFETARLMRSRQKSRDVPLIFLTAASGAPGFRERGYDLGAVDYLEKPYDPEILRSKVQALVALHEKNLIIQKQSELLRVAAERELRDLELRSARRYNHLAESMPHMVWIADGHGRLSYRNRRWTEFAGEQVKHFDSLLHEADRHRVDTVRARGEALGQAWSVEVRLRKNDGDFAWHLVQVVPDEPDAQGARAWIGTATDIDARKRAEDESAERMIALEQANQTKELFLATMSHELRTPLSAVLGWTALLSAGKVLKKDIGHAIEVVDRNARTLAHLVDDLLDVSRVVSGTLGLERSTIDLREIALSTVEAIRPAAERGGIALSTSTGTEPVPVFGDAARLTQVLSNLLQNAVKFTGRDGHVSVSIAIRDRRVIVAVEDDGAGIAPEFLPHVFERFRQGTPSTSSRHGLGLGLAICKHLVERHGGAIEAASGGAGHGSKFTIDLPLSLRSTMPPPPESKVELVTAMDREPLAGVRILLVEDDPDGAELVETFLRRLGATVRWVGSAAEGLAGIESEVPDLLLSDIGLPDLDGAEFVRRVRGRLPKEQLPALALTAYATQQDRAKSLAAGFQGHVTKPIRPESLLEAIQSALSGSPMPPSATDSARGLQSTP